MRKDIINYNNYLTFRFVLYKNSTYLNLTEENIFSLLI